VWPQSAFWQQQYRRLTSSDSIEDDVIFAVHPHRLHVTFTAIDYILLFFIFYASYSGGAKDMRHFAGK
jgi:hypothetical protein